MIQYVNSLASRILDFAMPPHCPVTQDDVESRNALSASAWSAIHFIEEPYCRCCGAPFSAEYGEGVECLACVAEPPDFNTARAALVYNDASHKMIVGFKHADRTELAHMFGVWMAAAGRSMLSRDTILTPVPLHPRRLLARRFNQSAMLARKVAAVTGATVSVGEFVRKRATPPQKELSRDGRKRNVAGAFGFRSERARERFRGAHVVLIDDVLTTGATVSAAARTLARAGANRIDALVLARVVKGGVGAI
ncbi:ComF family protein [Hyphococcus sp.]|uniref:ComF family protein n=1 Tax=Hyphococcus sp. TaxID=2038636 RepID=UPI003CCBF9A5